MKVLRNNLMKIQGVWKKNMMSSHATIVFAAFVPPPFWCIYCNKGLFVSTGYNVVEFTSTRCC